MKLDEVRRRFFIQQPAAGKLDASLQTPANKTPMFFMASVTSEPDLRGCNIALLRLGDELERRFDVNGEVAVYLTPWPDFQRRAFNAITLRSADHVRSAQEEVMRTERFSPSRRLALVSSGDPDIHSKLDEWQADSFSELTIVPIDAANLPKERLFDALIESLRIRLGERDLYRTQNPVSGVDFFGRTGLLRNLATALRGDQNVAILGLRRSGKTSVLQELRRVMLPQRVLMPIADFQMLDHQTPEELASSIASSLNDELKSAKTKGLQLWIGNESEQSVAGLSAVGLSDRIKRVAAQNPTVRIVIAVDEVESAFAIARDNPTAIKILLGALRSAAQARSNVSLIFSGVANGMFRTSSLGTDQAVDNPMFNQVESVYLNSFELEETSDLLQQLGRPMLLDWEPDAVVEVQSVTGGFPFFVRDLASFVRTNVRGAPGNATSEVQPISADDVRRSVSAWSPKAAEAWLGIVKALRMHYPAAAALLDPTVSEAELVEWIAADVDAASAAEDLLALGLFRRDSGSILYSRTLAALQRLGRRDDYVAAALVQANSTPADLLTNLIRGGESQTLELKETSRFNTRTSKADRLMEDEIVKTVAGFLNAFGGVLLVGVADDGAVRGLDRDLALFRNSVDRYERWLRGDLLSLRIDNQLVTENVSMQFVELRGKTVLRIDVTSSSKPAWVDDKTIFRRVGNQTRSLEGGRAIQEFLTSRGESVPS